MLTKETFFNSVALSLLVLLASACEDPSNVGLGLLDDAGGDPIVAIAPFSTFESEVQEGISSGDNEVLVGRVNDPLLGEITAEGYLDFFSAVLTTAYEEAQVDTVLLRLTPVYVYGDTLEEVSIEVHEVQEEFQVLGTTRDEIPPVSTTPLLNFSFMPTDTLVVVPMPDEWITQRQADLKTTDFSDLFFGLKMTSTGGNAIIGFDNTSNISSLQGIAAGDTVNYFAQKSFTDFARLTEPQIPADRILIQQGTGPHLRVNFDLTQLQEVGLNRAALRLDVDTTLLDQNLPTGFVRPEVSSVSLFGVFEDSTFFRVANDIPVASDGSLVIETLDFRNFVQESLLGTDVFEEYELRFTSALVNTVNPIVFHDTTSADKPPSLILTYTPLN